MANQIPNAALLTGGFDRSYVFGMATALAAGCAVEIIGGDQNDAAEFHSAPGIRFLLESPDAANPDRLADALFVHTPAMRTELIAGFHVPAEKIAVVPFGLNNSMPNTALTAAAPGAGGATACAVWGSVVFFALYGGALVVLCRGLGPFRQVANLLRELLPAGPVPAERRPLTASISPKK